MPEKVQFGQCTKSFYASPAVPFVELRMGPKKDGPKTAAAEGTTTLREALTVPAGAPAQPAEAPVPAIVPAAPEEASKG